MEEDHSYWGRPEDIAASGMRRPAFVVNATHPGSDVAAQAAAALAATATVRMRRERACLRGRTASRAAPAPTGLRTWSCDVRRCGPVPRRMRLSSHTLRWDNPGARGTRCLRARTRGTPRARWAMRGSCTRLRTRTAARLRPACPPWAPCTLRRSALNFGCPFWT